MRVFLFLLGSVVLSMGCSALGGGESGIVGVDVEATVEASVEATRVVERTVEAAADTGIGPTAVPTVTPVVMSVLAPTPEPYVVVPGSMERGAGVLYDCLRNDELFRDIFLSSVNSGNESVDPLWSAMLEDRDLFVRGMMDLANKEPDFAVMLSVYSGFGSGFCGPENAGSSPVVEDALGFWVAAYEGGWEGVVALMEAEVEALDADIEALDAEFECLEGLNNGVSGSLECEVYEDALGEDALGMEFLKADALVEELFDCYHSNTDVQDIMDSHVLGDSSDHYFPAVMRQRDMFVMVSRAYARQEDEGAERLAELDFVLETMCR